MKNIIRFSAAALLIAAAVSCSGPQKKASFPSIDQDGRIAVVAHRGFWNCEEAGFSENSIASLRQAQENGFWGSEFDVHLTSDDEVVVNHDNTIQGHLIWETPYSVLAGCSLPNGEKIPSLDEYLSQGEKCSTTMLVLEFKNQADEERENLLVDKTFAALKAHNLYDPSRVAFISFSANVCRKVAAEAPEFVNQYLNGTMSPDSLYRQGINGIDYNQSVIKKTPEMIGECHALGMSTNVWTVNADEDMEMMIGYGVDAITTNFPLRVRELLAGREFVITSENE